jgi:hypothetical protein
VIRQFRRTCVVVALSVLPVTSSAQGWGSIDLSIPMANTGYMLSAQIASQGIYQPSDGSDDDTSDASSSSDGSTTIPRLPVTRSSAPDVLAASYPATLRAEARALFAQLLDGYDPLMRQLRTEPDDYAAAAAVFVAGSYSAFHEKAFDDRSFAPLVRDLRELLSRSDVFQKAPIADKQAAFDQFAILGIMSALTQTSVQQMPPGAERDRLRQNMRAAGERYLEETFGVPAARVVIDRDGLRF